MTTSMTPLLLSLKPHYSDLIFEGLKKAELRRRSLMHMKGRDVFIYVTSPAMELRGGFRVGEVWSGTPEQVWSTVSGSAGVDKDDFDAYYAGRSIAYALEVTEVWQYANPVGLDILREEFQGFVVPQSWRYVRPEEYQSFRRMKRDRRTEDNVRGPDQTLSQAGDSLSRRGDSRIAHSRTPARGKAGRAA